MYEEAKEYHTFSNIDSFFLEYQEQYWLRMGHNNVWLGKNVEEFLQ